MNFIIYNSIIEKIKKKQILFSIAISIIFLLISLFIGWGVATDKFTSLHLMGLIILSFLILCKFKAKNLMIIYLFLFPFNYWTHIGAVNLNLNESLIFILFFLWSISFFVKGKINIKIIDKANPFKKWVLAYALLSLILIINSPLGDKSTYKAMARSIEYSMLFFIMASVFVYSDINLKKISRLLLASMAIVCSLGIIEFLIYNISFPQSFISFHQKMISLGIYPPKPLQGIINFSLEGKTIGSTFASKSALSIYLSAILPLVLMKILFTKDIFQKLIYCFLFMVGILNLFLTGSRVGLITFLIGILIIFYVLKIKKFFSIATIVILGILIFSYFLPKGIQTRLTFKSHESSLIGRKVYMERSIEIIKNNFLAGAGVDSLGAKEGKSKPHNAFLSEFQIKGIFGFLIIMGLFFSTIKNSFKNLKLMIKDKNDGLYALWSFVVIMIYFFTSFAAEPFYENQTSVLFILAVVISATFLRKNLNREKY
ncbi:MAG: O-antigen ligase family protein [Candidatus Helarchaeota archaeon]